MAVKPRWKAVESGDICGEMTLDEGVEIKVSKE